MLELSLFYSPEQFYESLSDLPLTLTLHETSVRVARVLQMPEGSEGHVVMSCAGVTLRHLDQPDLQLLHFVDRAYVFRTSNGDHAVNLDVSASPEFTPVAPTHLNLPVTCYTGDSTVLEVPPVLRPAELRTQLAERFGLPAEVPVTLFVNGHELCQSRNQQLRRGAKAERAVTLHAFLGADGQQPLKGSLPRRADTTSVVRVRYTMDAEEDSAAAWPTSYDAFDKTLRVPVERACVHLSALRHAVHAVTGVKPRLQQYTGFPLRNGERDPLLGGNDRVFMRPLLRPERIPRMPIVSCFPRPDDTTSLAEIEVREWGVPDTAVIHVFVCMDASVDAFKAMVRGLGVAIPPEHQRYFRFHGEDAGWQPALEALMVADFQPTWKDGIKKQVLYCFDASA